jgi:hypothetical protein
MPVKNTWKTTDTLTALDFNAHANQLNTNAARLAGQFAPADYGWISWAFDPALAVGAAPSNGVLIVVGLKVSEPTTVTNIVLGVQTAGSGLTTGQNFAMLYSPTGALLSSTADQSTAWASVGAKTMALTSAQPVGVGIYPVAFYSNATSRPSFIRAGGATASFNVLNTASVTRFAVSTLTYTTAPPTSLPALTTTGSANAYWAALS